MGMGGWYAADMTWGYFEVNFRMKSTQTANQQLGGRCEAFWAGFCRWSFLVWARKDVCFVRVEFYDLRTLIPD